MLRDKQVVEKVDDGMGDFTMVCLFKNVEDGSQWAFAGVYDPNLDQATILLCDELAGLRSIWDIPCCIRGDFNVTHFLSERSGWFQLQLNNSRLL